MLSVKLCGGLGNQLFQVAAAEQIATQKNRQLVLPKDGSPQTCHSNTNYFNSILSSYRKYQGEYVPDKVIHERSYRILDWDASIEDIENPELSGYFQNWRYISPNFKDQLVLPDVPEMKGVFLHIRGRDYVGHSFHDVGLEKQYYQNAIRMFPEGTHFFVFTNDRPYAEKQSYLRDTSYSFVDADEETTLAMMAKCEGGICANSSFSWWGAYLNQDRKLVLPSKWFNDPRMYIEDYYFPGCLIGQV